MKRGDRCSIINTIYVCNKIKDDSGRAVTGVRGMKSMAAGCCASNIQNLWHIRGSNICYGDEPFEDGFLSSSSFIQHLYNPMSIKSDPSSVRLIDDTRYANLSVIDSRFLGGFTGFIKSIYKSICRNMRKVRETRIFYCFEYILKNTNLHKTPKLRSLVMEIITRLGEGSNIPASISSIS